MKETLAFVKEIQNWMSFFQDQLDVSGLVMIVSEFEEAPMPAAENLDQIVTTLVFLFLFVQ